MNKIDQFIRDHTLSIRDIINGKKPENIDMTLLREASRDIDRIQSERDAAVREIAVTCGTCNFYGYTGCVFNTKDFCINKNKWEWRGPQPQIEPMQTIKRPEAQTAEKDLFKEYPYMGCNLEKGRE